MTVGIKMSLCCPHFWMVIYLALEFWVDSCFPHYFEDIISLLSGICHCWCKVYWQPICYSWNWSVFFFCLFFFLCSAVFFWLLVFVFMMKLGFICICLAENLSVIKLETLIFLRWWKTSHLCFLKDKLLSLVFELLLDVCWTFLSPLRSLCYWFSISVSPKFIMIPSDLSVY